MSLLTSTQGHPERVFSMLRTLEAAGGSMERGEALTKWFMPGPFAADSDTKPGVRITQTLGCAVDLGWVVRDASVIRLADTAEVPEDWDSFGDSVHRRLIETESEEDARLFRVYAFVLVTTSIKEGLGWLRANAEEVAELADKALRGADFGEGDRHFNSTKYTYWRRWMSAMGLGWDTQEVGFIPDLTPRLLRELPTVARRLEATVAVDIFLDALSESLPYVDRGTLYEEMRERLAPSSSPRRVSLSLSQALVEAEEEGALVLHRAKGDAREDEGVRLTGLGGLEGDFVLSVTLGGQKNG